MIGKSKSKLVERLSQPKIVDDSPHLVVVAKAGSGKTTSMVEGLHYVLGGKSKLVPSVQQQAIWDEMAKSFGKVKSICFCAFNRSIASELQQRVPKGVQAMTMHSLGYKAILRQFPNLLPPNSYRNQDIIAELMEKDIREIRKDTPVALRATEQLVDLVKSNLTDYDEEHLLDLAFYYDIALSDKSGDDYTEEVLEMVPLVLERSLDVGRDMCVSFSDMIWLPIALNLPLYMYDLLLIDELQDENRCQQELAKRSGKRIIAVGDPDQAIYAWAGADSLSMQRMIYYLSNDTRGCVQLPLNFTRRCGKAIVKEAQAIVPEFYAFEENCEGRVSYAQYTSKKVDGVRIEIPIEKTYIPTVQDGDMILCRCNAPLVNQCFKFLKLEKVARIQGRNIGQGLTALVKKMKADSVLELVKNTHEWLAEETAKERTKKNPSENVLIGLQDKAECVVCFTEGARTVDDVLRKIDTVFTDEQGRPGIKLSSIHKAKGLEAKKVYFLEPEGTTVPHPMCKSEWQMKGEWCLRYVAITRAIEELIYVR